MAPRIRPLILLAVLVLGPGARGANLDGSSPPEGDAEAARLYSEANDYVTSMAEGQYSYSYLQFYWKRAESNLDRIRKVYPDSPTAQMLQRSEAKVGPYALDYFRERVLYNLELKRLGAFDDVNCAIFLYGRAEDRSDAKRDEALAEIIEVLSRRQRWAEAARFPVLTAHRPILLGTIFRIAAFYGVDSLVAKMQKETPPAEQAAAHFDALQAEGLALRGRPRTELFDFIAAHPTDEVRDAALNGIVERELLIRRMQRLHIAYAGSIQTVHLVALNVALRDDVPAIAPKIYGGNLDAAGPILAIYYAGIGTAPPRGAPSAAHLAYLQYLADTDRFEAVATYATDNALAGPARRAAALKVIELYAEAGQTAEAEKARHAFAADFTPDADDAALAEFRGRMDSTAIPLVVREKTFADLPISDPCVMATATMEWSLTPNRSQRGATPWDAVVTRFAGGFDHLPKPKSAEVGDAASTLKPY